jgi:uncharacterized Zn-binding protein involved in type VI secretion
LLLKKGEYILPPAHRKGDNCTGHGSFPPRPITGASSDTFTNSKGQTRKGDNYMPHSSPSPSPPHGGSLATGSPNVFTNSLSSGRIADSVSCGSVAAVGSGNVFIN